MKQQKNILAERSSTLFLRVAIVAIGLVVLGLCALVLPAVYNNWAEEFPEISRTTGPILLTLSLTAITFFVALRHGWRILGYIDKRKAFSLPCVRALGIIKKCLLIIAGLYSSGFPIILYLAELDDAPGLILIYGAIFVAAPVVFAVGIAVLQRLLQNAIAIKSENDLTV